jgi:hypothetical protein
VSRNWAVFILTHNRVDKVVTVKSLRRCGYTGEIYFVIDNLDPSANQYIEKFGKDKVLIFDKEAEAKITDTGNPENDLRAVVFARNASQRMAKEMGLDYILMLDDDYTQFQYRYIENGILKSVPVKSFDKLAEAFFEFLDVSGAVTVAFSQGGDHIGGVNGSFGKEILRKAMNSFFLNTQKPVNFYGLINEDTCAYVVNGARGDLYFTLMKIQLNQVQTQKSSGGLTDIYLASGTYVKSFYTVMMAPSCTKIMMMGMTNKRFHHNIAWENAVPKIISGKFKKRVSA